MHRGSWYEMCNSLTNTSASPCIGWLMRRESLCMGRNGFHNGVETRQANSDPVWRLYQCSASWSVAHFGLLPVHLLCAGKAPCVVPHPTTASPEPLHYFFSKAPLTTKTRCDKWRVADYRGRLEQWHNQCIRSHEMNVQYKETILAHRMFRRKRREDKRISG